jgi:Leucine-rich repeat (LRR) protein
LDLSYNKLSGPLPVDFANLASLQELLLDVNAFEGGLPGDWAGLANLRKVFLSENKLTGPIPEAWGDLKLTDLWLEYNQVCAHEAGVQVVTAQPAS